MYVIQRTAPGERTQFWGRMDGWVIEPPKLRYSQLNRQLIPAAAYRYERHEVASDVAEALRMKNFEHGVVIAVISEPPAEMATA